MISGSQWLYHTVLSYCFSRWIPSSHGELCVVLPESNCALVAFVPGGGSVLRCWEIPDFITIIEIYMKLPKLLSVYQWHDDRSFDFAFFWDLIFERAHPCKLRFKFYCWNADMEEHFWLGIVYAITHQPKLILFPIEDPTVKPVKHSSVHFGIPSSGQNLNDLALDPPIHSWWRGMCSSTSKQSTTLVKGCKR